MLAVIAIAAAIVAAFYAYAARGAANEALAAARRADEIACAITPDEHARRRLDWLRHFDAQQ